MIACTSRFCSAHDFDGGALLSSSIIVHLQVSSATAQTSLFLIACSAFCAALMWWRPYESRAFFLAELASLACLLLTAALAPMTAQPGSDLTTAISDAATMLMIIANVATVAGLASLYALRAVNTYVPAIAAQLAGVSKRLPCCSSRLSQAGVSTAVQLQAREMELAPARERAVDVPNAAGAGLTDDSFSGVAKADAVTAGLHPPVVASGCSLSNHSSLSASTTASAGRYTVAPQRVSPSFLHP